MFYLSSVLVLFHSSFHFPLTAARPQWHRTLNFMEDGVTFIVLTYMKGYHLHANYLAIIRECSV